MVGEVLPLLAAVSKLIDIVRASSNRQDVCCSRCAWRATGSMNLGVFVVCNDSARMWDLLLESLTDQKFQCRNRQVLIGAPLLFIFT